MKKRRQQGSEKRMGEGGERKRDEGRSFRRWAEIIGGENFEMP